jgi:hypothetical protein
VILKNVETWRIRATSAHVSGCSNILLQTFVLFVPASQPAEQRHFTVKYTNSQRMRSAQVDSCDAKCNKGRKQMANIGGRTAEVCASECEIEWASVCECVRASVTGRVC